MQNTTIITLENPMRRISAHHVIRRKYSKWIVIRQQFDLVFTTIKVKTSLISTKLLLDLSIVDSNEVTHDPLLDESFYLINSTDPWYGDIIVYLQAQQVFPDLSLGDHRRICHQGWHCLVLNDTLYHHGVDTVLQCCLTHEEAEHVLNDCHARACGSHLSGMSTTHKILCARYYWKTLFKDCINVVQ